MLKLKISILPILRSKKKHASALPLKMLTGHLHFFLRILTNRFASLYLNRKLSPNSGIRKFNELDAEKHTSCPTPHCCAHLCKAVYCNYLTTTTPPPYVKNPPPPPLHHYSSIEPIIPPSHAPTIHNAVARQA